MSFLAGLMDINFPVSQSSLFKINILLNFCQNLLFLPLSSTLNHHGRFSKPLMNHLMDNHPSPYFTISSTVVYWVNIPYQLLVPQLSPSKIAILLNFHKKSLFLLYLNIHGRFIKPLMGHLLHDHPSPCHSLLD